MEDGSLEDSTMEPHLPPQFLHLHTQSDTPNGETDSSPFLSGHGLMALIPTSSFLPFHPSINLPNIYGGPTMCQEQPKARSSHRHTPQSKSYTYTPIYTCHPCPLTHRLLMLLHLSCRHFSHIHVPQTGLATTVEGSSVRAD